MKRGCFLVLALLVIGGGFAFWQYNRLPADLASGAADKELSAAALTQSFEQDAVAADEALQGKIIRLSGRVQRVNKEGAIVLQGSGASEVVVGLDKRYHGWLASLGPGSRVVVQGRYNGYQKSSDPIDLLAALGTTVQIGAAGPPRK